MLPTMTGTAVKTTQELAADPKFREIIQRPVVGLPHVLDEKDQPKE